MTSFSNLIKKILLFLLSFFLRKKSSQKQSKSTTSWQYFVDKKTNFAHKFEYNKKIRPYKRKVRGLDIENGGLEQSDDKKQKYVKDAWDDRSADLLKVGQVSPISSVNKKAMLLWYTSFYKTQKKIQKVKNKKDIAKLEIPKQIGSDFDSSKKQTFTQKISALSRQDTANYR